MTIKIFPAQRVITMNPSLPSASAVAVRDGKVLGVGTVEELQGWGDATIDERFADKVLLPGFVEAHTHLMAGGMWLYTYVGFFDRTAPDGTRWKGCTSVADVIDRLREIDRTMSDPHELLIAWGIDPIYLDERVLADHLDEVSTTRPIFALHASGHLAVVNHKMLAVSEITSATTVPGVSRAADGQPDGELQEPAAMQLARGAFGRIVAGMTTPEAAFNYAAEARNTGLTFITDLATAGLHKPATVEMFRSRTAADEFPARLMVTGTTGFTGQDPIDEVCAVVTSQRVHNDDGGKLFFGVVKIVLDGSIQGFTARLEWPYYFTAPEGHPGNGLWLVAPERLAEIVTAYHRAGMIIHTHCNGDQASEVFIDAVAKALEAHPRADHRHTVTHSQLTTKAQYRRMAALGMCANVFSNHIYFWGDQHRDVTVGPDRAKAMNAAATCVREGVPLALHCDAPVTPMGPLHVAWCAVNRLTATGEVLGEAERISVEQALHAVTLGAAYTLGVDHLVGSIECGKLADFAVLEDDPFEVDPASLKDIRVWGTVLGGVPQPAASA